MSGSPKPSTYTVEPASADPFEIKVCDEIGLEAIERTLMEVNWSHRNRPCAVKARTSHSTSPAETGALAPFTKVPWVPPKCWKPTSPAGVMPNGWLVPGFAGEKL